MYNLSHKAKHLSLICFTNRYFINLLLSKHQCWLQRCCSHWEVLLPFRGVAPIQRCCSQTVCPSAAVLHPGKPRVFLHHGLSARGLQWKLGGGRRGDFRSTVGSFPKEDTRSHFGGIKQCLFWFKINTASPRVPPTEDSSVRLSSLQDSMYTLGKSHVFQFVSQRFPKCCLWNRF